MLHEAIRFNPLAVKSQKMTKTCEITCNLSDNLCKRSSPWVYPPLTG